MKTKRTKDSPCFYSYYVSCHTFQLFVGLQIQSRTVENQERRKEAKIKAVRVMNVPVKQRAQIEAGSLEGKKRKKRQRSKRKDTSVQRMKSHEEDKEKIQKVVQKVKAH